MTEKGLRETSIVNPSSPPLCAGASACTHTFPRPLTEQQFIAVGQLSAGRLPEEHNRNPRSMQEGEEHKNALFYFIFTSAAQRTALYGKKKIREIQLWKKARTRSSAPGLTAKVTDGFAPCGHVLWRKSRQNLLPEAVREEEQGRSLGVGSGETRSTEASLQSMMTN